MRTARASRKARARNNYGRSHRSSSALRAAALIETSQCLVIAVRHVVLCDLCAGGLPDLGEGSDVVKDALKLADALRLADERRMQGQRQDTAARFALAV